MTERWNPAEFKDAYHDDLMARIRQKIKLGQTREITKPDAGDPERAPRTAQVIDLAELLRQSLDKGAGRRKSPARSAAPVPRAGARAALRLVAGRAVGSQAAKLATKSAPRRKRA